MHNLTHPALRAHDGTARADVLVSEWETVAALLSDRLAVETDPVQRERIRGQHAEAVAARSDAYTRREALLCMLLTN
jgi:hypothetical protein